MDEALPPPPHRSVDDQSGTLFIIACAFLPLILSYCNACLALDQDVVSHDSVGFLIAAVAGSLVVLGYVQFELRILRRTPWRTPGFIPYAFSIALPILLVKLAVTMPDWLQFIAVFFSAIAIIACSISAYSRATSIMETYVGLALILAGGAQIYSLIGAIKSTNTAPVEIFPHASVYSFILLSIGLIAFSWIRLKRHAYELWVESWMRFMYKIRATGPGLAAIPKTGPVLVVANHACWWDPLFVAGVLPRAITPMMTASFHDIWHLKPFMKHVIKAIRVPEKAVRHEAPEIDEAIAALKRGECVVIFAEGYLRRKEEIPLRRFGRGVYEILKGAPETPVVAGWIEGAWGSWCSWKDGPPTKNKTFDIRRRIDVSLSQPITVPAQQLEHHLATRMYLMNAVSAARKHLGLEPLPEFTVNLKDDSEESAA